MSAIRATSIRNKATRLGIAAIITTIVLLAIALFAYYRVRFETTASASIRELLKSAHPQADQLLVGFLLPEQRGGVDLLLTKFADEESLFESKIISGANEIKAYPECRLAAQTSSCLSHDRRYVGIVTPVREQEKIYAYYFKSRDLGLSQIGSNLFLLFAAISIVSGLVFLGFMLLVVKVISNELPRYFEEVIKWVEKNLGQETVTPCPIFPVEEFNTLTNHITEVVANHQKTNLENQILREQNALGGLAQQVAHDIRSPLAALQTTVDDLGDLPENQRILIRDAVMRIQDIANNLLDGVHPKEASNVLSLDRSKSEPVLLSSAIERIVSEKRSQYRTRQGIKIVSGLSSNCCGLFVSADSTQLKCILSNLINNAVESISESGTIKISLREDAESIVLSVKDSGKGMTSEVLTQVCEKGFTYGKSNGSGLGLYHAKTKLQEWGGSILISSKVGEGTEIQLILPTVKAPAWFQSKLAIPPNAIVAILDDEPTIHQVWDMRLAAAKADGVTVKHFLTSEEFSRWQLDGTQGREVVYLMDYELRAEKITGLDLILLHSVASNSILVTSRCDDSELQKRVEEKGVRMMPKELATVIPLETNSIACPVAENPYVLIDNDPLTSLTWRMSAEHHKKAVRLFLSPQEFFAVCNEIPKESPIYIDLNLGDGVIGTEVAKKVHALGFKQIFITTGAPAETVKDRAHLKGIIGKLPPWLS